MRNHLSCFLWQKYIESDEKRKAKKGMLYENQDKSS